MKLRRLVVDRTLREYYQYEDLSFPIGCWRDVYSEFAENTLNCHWHNDYEFDVLLSGSLDFYINDTKLEMKRGDCVFINKDTLHSAIQSECSEEATVLVITFDPSLLTGKVSDLIYKKYFVPMESERIQGFMVDKSTPSGAEIIENLLKIGELDREEYGYELKTLSLISDAWANVVKYINRKNESSLIARSQDRKDDLAKEIVSYIHAHYMEKLTVESIAKNLNISRSECFRCFKRFTDRSPVEYITEYRLAHAAVMLRSSTRTLSDICMSCGFSSASYFGKLFKEKYSVTPYEYRRLEKLKGGIS